jgi:hypothetical protein
MINQSQRRSTCVRIFAVAVATASVLIASESRATPVVATGVPSNIRVERYGSGTLAGRTIVYAWTGTGIGYFPDGACQRLLLSSPDEGTEKLLFETVVLAKIAQVSMTFQYDNTVVPDPPFNDCYLLSFRLDNL